MKKFCKRNHLNLLLVLVSFLLGGYLIYKNNIDVDIIKESDFVSINAIFAGFLFTSLGIVVGFLDKSVVSFIDKHGYLDDYINGIVFGLILHIASAVTELFIKNTSIQIEASTTNLIYELIFVLLISGILFFIKSFLNVMKLIKIIRRHE